MPLLSYAEHHGFATLSSSVESTWNRLEPCAWEPVLSPDAQWVACSSADALHLIGVDGSVVQVPGAWIWPGRVAWSPDSRIFAFVADDVLTLLRVANGSTSSVRGVTANSGPYLRQVFPQLSWSADGSHIAFTCGRPGARGVCVADASGRFLYEIDASTGAPAWNPAEDLVAYECVSGVCISELGDAKGAELYGQAGRPIWSPRGDELVVSEWGDRWYEDCSQLLVISRRGALRARLTADEECASAATWSPDGSHVAFTIGDEFGDYGVGIALRDGTQHMVLWMGGVHVSRPMWSPDSAFVASSRTRMVDTGVSTTETLIDSATGSASWLLPGWEIAAWPQAAAVDGSTAWPQLQEWTRPSPVDHEPLEPSDGFIVKPEVDMEERCIYDRCLELTADRSWLIPDGGFAGGYEGELSGYPIWRASGWWNDYEYVSGPGVDLVRASPTGCPALNASAPELGSDPLDRPTVAGGGSRFSGQALCDRAPVSDGVWVYLYTRSPTAAFVLQGATQVLDGRWELVLNVAGQSAFRAEYVTPDHRIEALPSSGIDGLTETLHLAPENNTLRWLLESGLTTAAAVEADLARLSGRRIRAKAGEVEQLAPAFYQTWVKVGGSACCRIALRFERLGDVAWAEVWDRVDGVVVPWTAPASVELKAHSDWEATVDWTFLSVHEQFELRLVTATRLEVAESATFPDPDDSYERSLLFEPGPVPTH